MNLNFNIDLAEGYKSNSQIARVLTENWVKENSYCPNCGQKTDTHRYSLQHFFVHDFLFLATKAINRSLFK